MKTRALVENGGRNPERGAIALIVAALWMTLFGLAAFAVDVGYQYTSKRGLQAATDAAVRAGMPSLSTNWTAAHDNAVAMAGANGFVDGQNGATVNVTRPTATRLQVNIGLTTPSFFLKIFGYNTRTLSGQAIGQLNTVGGPAIHGNKGCAATVGVKINGGSPLTVSGNVEGNGQVYYSTSGTTVTNGSVNSPCPGFPLFIPGGDTVTGGTGTATFPDPFLGTVATSFTCTVGNLTSSNPIPFGAWLPTSPPTLPSGVYCSNTDFTLSGTGTDFNATGVTLVTTGHINVGANAASTWTAYPGVPNGIVAFAGSTDDCMSGTPAINIGNNSLTVTGSFYTPLGCINAGGTNMRVDGSLVGGEVQLGMGPAGWIINAAVGGGSGWTMFQ